MGIRMRILDAHHRLLLNLLSDMTREQACFLVCGEAGSGGDDVVLLVQEVLALAPGDFRVHESDQISLAPSAMLRIARYAQKHDGSICMVHTHPMSKGHVAFSRADDLGNERTFEFFGRMLPSVVR